MCFTKHAPKPELPIKKKKFSKRKTPTIILTLSNTKSMQTFFCSYSLSYKRAFQVLFTKASGSQIKMILIK